MRLLANDISGTSGESLVNKIVAVTHSAFDGYKYIAGFDLARIGAKAGRFVRRDQIKKFIKRHKLT
jgi:hypothetical protein